MADDPLPPDRLVPLQRRWIGLCATGGRNNQWADKVRPAHPLSEHSGFTSAPTKSLRADFGEDVLGATSRPLSVRRMFWPIAVLFAVALISFVIGTILDVFGKPPETGVVGNMVRATADDIASSQAINS